MNEIIPLAIPYHSSMIPMSMQCICKILFQFVYSFLRYRPKMHFGHKSRAITLLFLNEIIPLAIPYRFSLIPMSMQSLKKIGQKVLKLEHGNEALMDGQTELFLNEIIPLAIPYHSSLIPMSMQCICKILFQFVYSVLRYRPKMHFGHKSRAITLLFLNEIIPLAIPYHSSPIPMSLQSKMISNDQELIQSNPTSCPQNQKGNN